MRFTRRFIYLGGVRRRLCYCFAWLSSNRRRNGLHLSNAPCVDKPRNEGGRGGAIQWQSSERNDQTQSSQSTLTEILEPRPVSALSALKSSACSAFSAGNEAV
jgi:hypothetical protein